MGDRRASLRSRLVASSVLPIALIGASAALSSYTAVKAVAGVNRSLERYLTLDDALEAAGGAEEALESYLVSKGSEDLRTYMRLERELAEVAKAYDSTGLSGEAEMLERNVATLIKRFIDAGQEALRAKRGRNVPAYGAAFARVERLSAYLADRADALSLLRLDESIEGFGVFDGNIARARDFGFLTILAALVFDAFAVAYLSLKLTDPLRVLADEARKIADGAFDGPPLVPPGPSDEVVATTEAFNVMKVGILRYVEELREKSSIESRLMEERVKNLEMATALRDAELAILQSRINPHFLFNTLNAGLQLSTIEGAERTRVFLGKLASLMRYSFRGLDAPVTVADEVENLRDFLYLMSIRFPDRFAFEISVDDECRRSWMPKLSLQPLAENAIRHGFVDPGRPGTLRVRAMRSGELCVLEVSDDGVGMDESVIARATEAVRRVGSRLDGDRSDSVREGIPRGFSKAPDERFGSDEPGSGMGLSNVIRRMALFTGSEGCVRVVSSPGRGTAITLSFPLEAGA
jgi:signal transduction histidine kinase